MIASTVGNNLWCIRGDMNMWLTREDRKRGARVGNKPCRLFKEWVQHNVVRR